MGRCRYSTVSLITRFDFMAPVTRLITALQCICLSYDVAVIQWIMSCHKNHMTTRVITLWLVIVTSLTMSMSMMCFLAEIMFVLKVIKSHLRGSYDNMINRILHSFI